MDVVYMLRDTKDPNWDEFGNGPEVRGVFKSRKKTIEALSLIEDCSNLIVDRVAVILKANTGKDLVVEKITGFVDRYSAEEMKEKA